MTDFSITRPLTWVVSSASGVSKPENLATWEPKQVAVCTGGPFSIVIDLGAVVPIDTIFLGFTNDDGTGALTLRYGAADHGTALVPNWVPLATKLIEPRRAFLHAPAAAISARYIELAGDRPAGYQLGVLAAGEGFRPTFGADMGHGAAIGDTAVVTDRKDGGIGIDPGATYGTWEWTLANLSDDDRDDLFALLRDRGNSKPAIVIEGQTGAVLLGERVHWATFRQIEKYERTDVGLISWSLKIRDWE